MFFLWSPFFKNFLYANFLFRVVNDSFYAHHKVIFLEICSDVCIVWLFLHCVLKKVSPTLSNYQILIIFGINIPYTTTYHQMTI